MDQGPSAARVRLGLLGASPLFQTHRTTVVQSPHHVNEMLFAALPAAEQSRAAERMVQARRFEPTDRRGYQLEPAEFALSVAVAHVGGMRVSASVLRRGMAMTVFDPRPGGYTFGFRTRGGISVSGCGAATDGAWGPGTGVIYREREGARIATTDGHSGVAFEISAARVAAILGALTERPAPPDAGFAPSFSLSSEPGASIARIVAFIEQELAAPDSLLSRGVGAQEMEDMLIRSLLSAQPHACSALLERAARGAAPFNVVRAEAFMQAHAHEALTAERIAEVAGCGVRSLQVSFRRFRGCTPMQELRRIRLERAQRELRAGAPGLSVTDVAARYGFSSPGRFAGSYRAMFGEAPSQTLRKTNG